MAHSGSAPNWNVGGETLGGTHWHALVQKCYHCENEVLKPRHLTTHLKNIGFGPKMVKIGKRTVSTIVPLYMLNCKINGTVHIFFFLKSIAQPPVNETAPIFFSRGVFPSYYHVISDFCHIWGPFMAKIEKMCQKSAFLVVPSQNH